MTTRHPNATIVPKANQTEHLDETTASFEGADAGAVLVPPLDEGDPEALVDVDDPDVPVPFESTAV